MKHENSKKLQSIDLYLIHIFLSWRYNNIECLLIEIIWVYIRYLYKCRLLEPQFFLKSVLRMQINWNFNVKRYVKTSEMEFKEFKPRFKSAKTRFKLSAGLNLETFDTILSGTNHI